MGEYIRDTKLGTCENLYYSTFEQLKNTKEFSADEKSDFLKIDSGYRFRFPFPDENINIGTHEDHDRGFLITIPDSIGVEISHSTTFTRVGFRNANAQRHQEFGIEIPCPQDKENRGTNKIYRWHNEGFLLLEIVQQKYTTQQGGEMLTTVARCPYCGERSQLTKDEILAMIAYFDKANTPEVREQNREVLSILGIALQGYEINELQPV